jgi:hypothetical protein
MATTWANFVLDSYRRLILEELTFNERDKKVKKVADIIRNSGRASMRDVTIATRYEQRELLEITRTLEVMGKVARDTGERGGIWFEWVAPD